MNHKTTTLSTLPQSTVRSRQGITIMEVMFAIALVLVGLTGLTALIPVAAKYANDSMRMDEAIQEGASASSQVISEKLARYDRMVIVTDDNSDIASPGPSSNGATTSGRGRLLSHARIHDATLGATGLLYDPALPTSMSQTIADTGMIDSPGFRRPVGSSVIQLDRFAGFCIDPMGWQQAYSGFPANPPIAYRAGVFPYYKPLWNPLGSTTFSTASGSNDVLTLPTPRLWRCSIARGNSEDIVPHNVTATDVLDYHSASRLFQLPGNPAQQALKDRSYAAARLFYSDTSSMTPLTGSNRGRYSWFATLTPGPVASTVYTLSTVILESRVFEAFPSVAPTDPELAPRGERLAWVYDFVGFDGGSGGDVGIVATAEVVNRLRVGQWVMLSRQDYNYTYNTSPPQRTSAVNTPIGPASHAWYRILATSEANVPATFPATIPSAGTAGMWARNVTLSGPDWRFNLVTPNDETGTAMSANFFGDDTVMTIVDGAVEVIQSQVILE